MAKRGGMDKSTLPNQEGDYAKFDFVVGSRRMKLPKELECGREFVIYSPFAEFLNKGGPDECKAFSASRTKPSAKGKKIFDQARARADEAAKKIDCPKDCPDRVVDEIWRGWRCDRDDILGWDLAIVAVELRVVCRPEP